eukprot:355933-Rhodomonas_salina.2
MGGTDAAYAATRRAWRRLSESTCTPSPRRRVPAYAAATQWLVLMWCTALPGAGTKRDDADDQARYKAQEEGNNRSAPLSATRALRQVRY